MNNRIGSEKIEPKPKFENTINEIKNNHLKSITYIAMNLSTITSNKSYSYSEHLKYNIIPWIILQSPVKSPKFTKPLSSMHPKGNTQLQMRKWWIPLRSALYISFHLSEFYQYLSINRTICPTDKHSKRHFTSSKQQFFIHQHYQYKMSNLKESWKCIMWFTTIAQGKKLNPNFNIQPNTWETSTRS